MNRRKLISSLAVIPFVGLVSKPSVEASSETKNHLNLLSPPFGDEHVVATNPWRYTFDPSIIEIWEDGLAYYKQFEIVNNENPSEFDVVSLVVIKRSGRFAAARQKSFTFNTARSVAIEANKRAIIAYVNEHHIELE